MGLASKPQRIYIGLKLDMDKIAQVRVNNNLAKLKKEDISIREMTRLLTKTTGYKQALKELEWKQKKND